MPRIFAHSDYRAPASALIDGFGGCTRCTVIEVIEPGEGNQFMRGRIRARVDETHGGYAKGEIVVMGPHNIVPRDRLYSRGFHYYINTQYAWVKEDRAHVSGQPMTPGCQSCLLGDKSKVHSSKHCPGYQG
ncbi:MAG TPA: hypothetical protein PKI20_00200 [Verrucomicrobiota bacterium]|nr:hypothetical protein [Verrucomicrobiota bacterium]